ncbi:MAG: hypothetical protein Q8S31_03670 [Alphaproteobacteria bacterium]|nr:hypothetical protein [Alphaproteobacteria bacterium]
MSLPKFFIIFIFMTFNFKICESTLTQEQLKEIKFDLRFHIALHDKNQKMLVETAQLLKDREFEVTDPIRFLTESQTIGLAIICYQNVIILNAACYDYNLIIGELYEKWAALTKPHKKEKILKKYKLAFQNYMCLFGKQQNNEQPLSKIASLAKKFYDELHILYFDNKSDCLEWIYKILFGEINIDGQKLKNKIQHTKKSEILWNFLINLEQKFGKDVRKIFNLINE